METLIIVRKSPFEKENTLDIDMIYEFKILIYFFNYIFRGLMVEN